MIILAIGIAGLIIGTVLAKRWQTAERETSVVEQTPVLTELAERLGGTVIGPDDASAWSAKLQRHRPNLNLDFQRGPWHVRVSEVFIAREPLLSDNLVAFEHWIEVATAPVPTRRVPLEFFTLYFEDGFVRVECEGQIRPDEIVFLVDMILETLDLMPGVEPRNPAATA